MASEVIVLNESCLFCKIIQKTIPSTIVKENDFVMAIHDIHPKAPIHYLLIPKTHIESVTHITDQDQSFCWHLFQLARDLGAQVPTKAFNLISNNGAAAGQSVPHLHWHFLAGKNLYEHGLTL